MMMVMMMMLMMMMMMIVYMLVYSTLLPLYTHGLNSIIVDKVKGNVLTAAVTSYSFTY